MLTISKKGIKIEKIRCIISLIFKLLVKKPGIRLIKDNMNI